MESTFCTRACYLNISVSIFADGLWNIGMAKPHRSHIPLFQHLFDAGSLSNYLWIIGPLVLLTIALGLCLWDFDGSKGGGAYTVVVYFVWDS